MNQNFRKNYLRRVISGEISFSDFDTLSSIHQYKQQKG